MATQTLNDVTLDNVTWVDLTVDQPLIIDNDVAIQNISANGGSVFVVFGGSDTPSGKSGTLLRSDSGVKGNSDHVWAKARDDRGATVSVTLS